VPMLLTQHKISGDQILGEAERLVAAWNKRQAQRLSMLFAPTIGAAISTKHWYLWVLCPSCLAVSAFDLRRIRYHRYEPITYLVAAVSCRSCWPNAPSPKLVCLSPVNIADELREGRRAATETVRVNQGLYENARSLASGKPHITDDFSS
jgi:hypothetical protein